MKNTIGETIKHFRKQKNLSQLDLELKIGSSQGSMSRIENGEVNPSKETLLRIIEALELHGHEAGILLGLNVAEFTEMIDLTCKFSSSLDLDRILQNSVDELCKKMNYIGINIALVEGNILHSRTITQNIFMKLCLRIINQPLASIQLSLITDRNNLVVKSILEKKYYIGYSIYDFGGPALSKKVSALLERVTPFKSAISIPLIVHNTPIGAMFFIKNVKDDFQTDLAIFKSFTDYIAILIHNSQQYEKLKEEIEILKQNQSLQTYEK
jgi:transcriptional regulator with XRE-family HTH domain